MSFQFDFLKSRPRYMCGKLLGIPNFGDDTIEGLGFCFCVKYHYDSLPSFLLDEFPSSEDHIIAHFDLRNILRQEVVGLDQYLELFESYDIIRTFNSQAEAGYQDHLIYFRNYVAQRYANMCIEDEIPESRGIHNY